MGTNTEIDIRIFYFNIQIYSNVRFCISQTCMSEFLSYLKFVMHFNDFTVKA